MRERQIVNAQEMRQLDRLTIEEKNITSYDLMKKAGTAIFHHVYHPDNSDLNGTYLIVAGTGNNGGDALIVADMLFSEGAKVRVIIVGEETNQSEESIQAYQEVIHKGIPILRVLDTEQISDAEEWIEEASTVIDGLFGIGLSRPIEGVFTDIINLINLSYARVISIDIPSGINADNGLVMGTAVHANQTLIIQNYKQGNLLNDALDYSGIMTVLDVGILQTIFPEVQTIIHKTYLQNRLPKRSKNSYKYHYGNVLTIGGSKGMMGAPLLASYAALRTGSGLSHLLYHESYMSHATNIYPDIMMNSYIGIEEIPGIVQKKTAVIFGPGLGKSDSRNIDVLNYLLSTNIPLVIDADGIFYLKQLLKDYSDRPNIIITPHYKEMAEFLQIPIQEVELEPILYARNIAHKYNITVVLKGTCTIITNNQQTYFSINGNPGLATAGTGDVLAGIIGSLVGRNIDPLEASKLGVLIHSRAGELACEEFGEDSMIASDVITKIPQVIQYAKS